MNDGQVAPEGQVTPEFVTPDGGFDVEKAPVGIKELLVAKKWTKVQELANGYTELEKFRGVPAERLLTLPEKEDSPDWQKIYQRLGTPETSDGYEVKVNTDLKLDDALIGDFKKFAHKMGLNKKQFNNIVQFQVDASKAMLDSQEKAVKDTSDESARVLDESRRVAVEALKKEHGLKTDADMQALILKAKKVSEDLNLLDVFEENKLSDNPKVISRLIALSKKISNSALPGKEMEVTPDKKQQLEEIMKNPALTNAMHPEHKAVHKRFKELHGITG
jgi:hypothetical protein